MKIFEAQERYNRWWLGRFCRRAFSIAPFKLVTAIKLHGPPSFVYGVVELCYEDGTSDNIAPIHAFKARKCDVEVKPER